MYGADPMGCPDFYVLKRFPIHAAILITTIPFYHHLLDQGTSPEWNVSLQQWPLHLPWLPLVSEQRQNSWVWPSVTPIPRMGLPHCHSNFSLCTPAVLSSLTLLLARNCPSGGLSLEQSSPWCLLVLPIPGRSSLPRETLPYSHTHTLIIHLIAFCIFLLLHSLNPGSTRHLWLFKTRLPSRF